MGGGFFEKINGVYFFCLLEDYWFLQALFFSKIIYYLVRKYECIECYRFFTLLLFTFAGFYAISYYSSCDYDYFYHFNNYLHYKDCLCMTIFLWVGDFFKRHNMLNKLCKGKIFVIILLTYVSAHLFRLIARVEGIEVMWLSPVVLSHGGNISSMTQIPAFFFYTILGSLSCFGIAKKINNNRILEYYGRNSLVVYCIHFFLLDIYTTILYRIISPIGIVNSSIFTLLILLLCIISCVPIISLFGNYPFNFLIGKAKLI